MKTKKIAIAILLLLIYSNSYSQDNNLFLSLDGGLNKLLAQSRDYKDGFSIGGKIGYKFHHNFISGIKIDYSSNKPPNPQLSGNNSVTFIHGGESIKLGIKAFIQYGNFKANAKLIPYFLIGAGADLFRQAEANTLEFGSLNGSRFSLNVGLDFAVGLGFKMIDNTTIYIEPKFTGSFPGGISAQTSASVKAGVMYSF